MAHPVHPGGYIHGCNMTCSRAVIDQIGGFDATFGAGAAFRAGEDTDFIYRGWAAGIPVEYVPDMSVKHFHGRRDVRSVMRLHWNYQFGNGALYAKHVGRRPSLLKHLYWAARNAGREMLGGQRFDEEIGLTWRSMFVANLCGFLAYSYQSIQAALMIP
ncbi:glycosyltransferase family 2 protein [Methylobacterium sp. P31]